MASKTSFYFLKHSGANTSVKICSFGCCCGCYCCYSRPLCCILPVAVTGCTIPLCCYAIVCYWQHSSYQYLFYGQCIVVTHVKSFLWL